jgi:hypothetical protein
MNSTVNLDPIIRKADGPGTTPSSDELLITIDSASGKAIEKTLFVRVGGRYQDYLVANKTNPTRTAGGKLSYYVRDAQQQRTLAIDISFQVSCPKRQESKVAEALHGVRTPAGVFMELLERWVCEFIPLGDEGNFIDAYDAAKGKLERHLIDRAHKQTGLELSPVVTLSRQGSVPTEIVVGPIEIGIRLHLYPQEQKMTVEAGLELDDQNYVHAFVFREGQESAEELFKRKLKEYFFENVTIDQFSRELRYPSFTQPIRAAVSAPLKHVGRGVRFISMSTSEGIIPPPPELVLVNYNYKHFIHGRTQPVTIQNTVQLYSQDSVSFHASNVGNLETWVKNDLDVVLRRHLIGQTYVDLLLRFEPVIEKITRDMGQRARAIGYRLDHLLSIPDLTEKDLKKPFDIDAEDTFETRLEGFEVQLKFSLRLRIPKLESVEEKYLNPGTDVKEAIKRTVLNEARQCLRDVPPERFYLYFNRPNEAANANAGDERLPVKELLSNRIKKSLTAEFKAEILELSPRVGRSDLTERHRSLCNVIKPFRVSIESPDPQATESLTLTGNFVLRGVFSDLPGWQRFSVLQLDLDGLKDQLETHLRAELKTFYQSGFMFQNRRGHQQVFNLVKNYAGIYMREEFGLIIHLTNLDRNTTLAEESQRRLIIDFETNKIAALVDQSKHLVDRLKELRRQRIKLLSVSPIDKETMREIDESIEVLEAELESVSVSRFGQHRLSATSEAQFPDELPPVNEEPATFSPTLEPTSKGQLTG